MTPPLPQIQQHSLNAMMGAIDGSDLPDPDPVGRISREASQQPQGRRQDSNVRHALSELHNLQQHQTSPSHA